MAAGSDSDSGSGGGVGGDGSGDIAGSVITIINGAKYINVIFVASLFSLVFGFW